MPYNFYKLLKRNDRLKNMPPVSIRNRPTDKSIRYNKDLRRLDTIAADIYDDETMWRLILWANEQYFLEFDIPDNTILRVPFPLQDVLNEVQAKITERRDKA